MNCHTQQITTIQADVSSEQRPISPYIFGKNNCLSDKWLDKPPLSTAEWQRLRDLGINMFRENGGNNSSKYNWRRKLSSHPNWYNNVYAHDWDYAAGSLKANIPSAQGMWAFQLTGKAARTSAYNFNDWAYNGSQWWEGVEQNLAGGGQVNPAGGSKALVDGDPGLYLEDWNADSTVGILDRWFGPGGIGLDSTRIRYWNMDNEPEIWNGTHDDIWPTQPGAEEFMQIYFNVAKKARAKYPGIKLLGPVPANEWQWYNWNGSRISYQGQQYVWLEYFILRIAEEQQASGIRLLDVLDIHFYPGETSPSDIVQLHRVFFDETYSYPGANGVRRLGAGGWDVSITREYILKRCSDWLEKYMGTDHGVTFSVTETGIEGDNPNVTASWYASTLGEFARQGVEIFTPWTWKTGMNEVVHLFSHYSKPFFIDAISSEELYVSAYPTVSEDKDSMVIFLINRHLTGTRKIKPDLAGFPVKSGMYKMYRLSDLPQYETFVSHTNNALEVTDLPVSDNEPEVLLPPLSVSAVVLKRAENIRTPFGYLVAEAEAEDGSLTGVTVASSASGYSGTGYVTGLDNEGDNVTIGIYIPEKSFYKLVIRYRGASGQKYQDLLVNNKPVSSVRYAASDTFTFVEAGSCHLEHGINQISIRKGWGWTDIDKIEIYPALQHVYHFSPDPADSLASDTARSLYRFLLTQFGDRIISGHTHYNYDQLKDTAGKSPVLRVADFQHFTEGYPYLWENGGHTFGKHDDGSVDELINWHQETGGKGIISYQWHWHSPFGGEVSTNTFYTSLTTFDVSQAVIPGTQEYDSVIRDIDDIAAELKKFQDASIPVLWRPLHEAGGGWFWWGAKGPEPCKELYNMLFDRLKNHHQLHNLIWVWSSPEEDWYPGNDKVDIIGHDSYPGAYHYGTQKFFFDELYRLTEGEKLIAMTENGPIPDPGECLRGDAPWLYFMSWDTLVFGQNATAHIRDVYEHPDVITLESDNIKTGMEWRSVLYPEDWKPGFKDAQGRFLHDFSYAGYHRGEKEIPGITENIVDVTQPPYNADNTGASDVTAIIQQAVDDAGISGGGVVYLPAGTYRIRTPDSTDHAILIAHDSTVLRGAGPDSTFLFHDQTYMRFKNIIQVMGEYAGWFDADSASTGITLDLPEPTRILPVESVAGFETGDQVIVTSSATDEFIDEHHMTGYWTAGAVKGVAFLRRIDSVDTDNNLLIIDAPTRYYLKTRDQARVYHAKAHISECGIENLSIGNTQNPKTGWDEESYSDEGTGAWDVHFSHVIRFDYSNNCWVKNVHTYRPAVNTEDFHVLSNCLLLDQCRFITVDSCCFQKPQYEGGGGNGYMYTLQANDCLVKNSIANHSRHNYDFKYPYSNGNVIHQCRAENSKYASDFHMYLSMSNLFDGCTVNADYLESVFRPWGGNAIHGYSSTQSVFYNTRGEAYHPEKNYIVESRQFGNGYIIGTSGPADDVVIDPAEGLVNGYYYNTSPRDFTEGTGRGKDLIPSSLYLDQLDRRLAGASGIRRFSVNVIVKDSESDELIPDCRVKIYDEIKITDENGLAAFNNVLEVFVLTAENDLYIPPDKKQYVICSDTTLIFLLTRKTFNVSFRIFDQNTLNVLSDASVTLGEETKTTDINGEVMFVVYGGEHSYSVGKIKFQGETGILNIRSDTSYQFNIVQVLADIKFRLKEGTAPLNNALVKINGDSLITNSLGIALFRQLPVPADYSYVITKSGFAAIEGNIFLTSDTTIDFEVNKLSINDKLKNNGSRFRIWPNPVNDILYCSFPVSGSDTEIRITDMYGRQLFVRRVEGSIMILNVKDYKSGIYLICATYGKNRVLKIFTKI
ncbi:MAG: T9SS type A sorting domain-containing protein [Bacteroidales bacterium]|nr:T9SS type A sorting domain-containing protein [Bacteroidales bacterium]